MTDIELSGLEVKPYIHIQKNCRPSASGYVMEAIDSTLVIDLSHFDNNSKITINTKRISGNGKVKINDKNYEVLSKESNHLEIQTSEQKLSFTRDNSCIGKIIIANIKISINDVQVDINPGHLEPKTIPKNPENWKSLLLKCGEVRGIKLINERLLVSEGAYIQNGNLIEYIYTEPPQCFTKSDTIKFIYPCEITAISFNDGFALPPSKNKYKHFSDPTTNQAHIMTENNTPNIIAEKTPGRSDNIIYDSFETGFNSIILSNPAEFISGQGKNNNGAILKRNACFSIPLSILQPNMQYVIVVNVKKISGNGKFGIEITTTDNVSKSSTVTIAPDREVELYLKLNTEIAPTPGNTYMLKFFRPEESTVGDILLNRIMVINGITLANFANTNTPKMQSNYNVNKSVNKKETDLIRAVSKFYSRSITHNKTSQEFNFVSEITLRGQSAINWFNKIKPICPKLKLTDNSKILIGELGSLVPAEKIWLDAFNGEIKIEEQNILNDAKIILSPSLQNAELLATLFPHVSIQLAEKTWPMIDITPIKYLPENYTVMFHRDNNITSRIVESYGVNNPTLILIGSQIKYEGNVLQLNEYVSYDKILNILLNSKLLIDIAIVDDYKSGLLSLAFDNGVPVLTSNWFGLGKDNCRFIPSKDKVNELNIPKIIDIKNGIEDGLNLNKTNLNINHNEKLNKILTMLSG